MIDLTGKAAVVTGGSRGIGRAIAVRLATQGADVAFSYRGNEAAAAECGASIEGLGRRAVPVQGDATDPSSAEALVKAAIDAFGRVDILVNNAGVNIRGNAGDLSESDWDTVVDTNLKGPFLVARAFAPAMCERGWGRVIMLSSMLATIALPGRAPYASSKAGVSALTRVLALEWASAGVTVTPHRPE